MTPPAARAAQLVVAERVDAERPRDLADLISSHAVQSAISVEARRAGHAV